MPEGAAGPPASAPPLRRARSLRKRLRRALRHRPKRALYPLLAIGRALPPQRSAGLPGAGRVLLLRELNTLGDALISTPAVRALHRTFPDLELAMVAGWRNAAVWRHNPHLARLFVLERGPKALRFGGLVGELRAWSPDACVTLESLTCHATLDVLARLSGAPLRIRYDGAAFGLPHTNAAYNLLVPFSAAAGAHQIELCAGTLRPFGVEVLDRRLELVPGAEAERRAARALSDAGVGPGEPFCVVHPGSKQVHNRWPLEDFLTVLGRARGHRLRALLSFGPSEEPTRAWFAARGVPARDLLPSLRLEEVAALLARARLLVCPDTGVLHVGAAVGAPVVGLYGSGDPRLWQPPGDVRAVHARGRGNVRDLALADVLRAVDEALSGGAAARPRRTRPETEW
ncbi:MAG: glycosyltransferase family 9 protein [Gemmatimonadota bacterium]